MYLGTVIRMIVLLISGIKAYMINLLKKKKKFVSYIPFVVFFIIMLLYHWHLPMLGDDINYSKKMVSLQWLYDDYTHWSSRLITESILIYILHFPFKIWKICNVLIFLLLALNIKRFVGNCVEISNQLIFNFLICTFILIYPIKELSSAGWAATSNNYLWPIVFFLLSLKADYKIINNEMVTFKDIFFSAVLLIIAVDVEYVWVYATILFMGEIYYWGLKRSLFKFVCVKSIILIIAFLKIALAPGNKARYIIEVQNWYPDFPLLTLFEKIYMGFITSSIHLLGRSDRIIVVLLIALTVLVFYKSKNLLLRGILVSDLILKFIGVIKDAPDMQWPLFNAIVKIPATYIMSIHDYLALGISVYIFLSVLLGLYIVYKDDRKVLIFTTFIYLAGVFSRFIMLLSPTLFASSNRTFFGMEVSFMIISLLLVATIFNHLIPQSWKDKLTYHS